MPIRERVFVLVVTATTDDGDFIDPEDLSEVATVMTGAMARGVTTLRDLTLYAITPDDGPDSNVWLEVQRESQQQLTMMDDVTNNKDSSLITTISATVNDASYAYQTVMARRNAQDVFSSNDFSSDLITAHKTVAGAARQLQRLLDTPNLSSAIVERIQADFALLQHWGENLVLALMD